MFFGNNYGTNNQNGFMLHDRYFGKMKSHSNMSKGEGIMEKNVKAIPVFEQYQGEIRETVNSVLERVGHEIRGRGYVLRETCE